MTTDHSAIDKGDNWRRDLGWLVRLVLIVFAGFSLASWPDLLFKMDAYDQWIGSMKACQLNAAHCSWRSYLLAQIIPSLLGIAAVVALRWRRLPRRETILNMLAIAVCLYVIWSVAEIALHITGQSTR